jgi:hypothetical protein
VRVAYAVKPLGLVFVYDQLLLPVLDGIRDGRGQKTGLFDQFNQGLAYIFQWAHDSFLALTPNRR